MIELDPRKLFRRLAGEIPKALHKNMLIVGSLAAAYHYRAQLKRRAVNTKDADVVVHPAGNVASCKSIAEKLLREGWTRTDKCHPEPRPHPREALRAIRLHPPEGQDYFVELLGLPKRTQREAVLWVPVRLADGWYGVGCHRFMALVSARRIRSKEGLEYAAPSAMALANLLSHPGLGEQRMSDPIQGQAILRSAKDLGRVLALAWLEGRSGTEAWVEDWRGLLKTCSPAQRRPLARRAGDGLRALLGNPSVLREAHLTTSIGLLSGLGVSVDMLRLTGERLLSDALSPLAENASL